MASQLALARGLGTRLAVSVLNLAAYTNLLCSLVEISDEPLCPMCSNWVKAANLKKIEEPADETINVYG